jgi:L-seryl-tRNA(Ser) seleniumtransferase
MSVAGAGFASVEYDLVEGARGRRSVHAERLLRELTGAEAALVVNNNAGAVLLALTVLAQGRSVIISRGQLIEIGGGFRVPDVMALSGAHLVEVGPTNRTLLYDYESAFGSHADVALILRAHSSNFRVVGFTTEPELAELAGLAQERGIPLMDDLGSGALLDTSQFGLRHEPTVQESISAGAAVVCFSGDKLLGGPQAGLIVGQARYIDLMKRHPLTRALRPDKLCLAALQATLMHYLREEAAEHVPVWAMIAQDVSTIDRRAKRWRRTLRRAGFSADVIHGLSTVGGGSLPGETLPTRLLALNLPDPDSAAVALRGGDPPVVARIEDGRLVLDPRTVLPGQDRALLEAIGTVCGGNDAGEQPHQQSQADSTTTDARPPKERL